MHVYLSGPMSGIPQNNFPAFHSTARLLREAGYEVVNPAEINQGVTATWHDYLRADLRAMMDCDAIALMRGWENSSGANLELHVAHRVGMKVVFVDDLLPVSG